MTLPMSRDQFKFDYLLKKCGIGVSGNISAFQAEVDSSSLLFHSIYIAERIGIQSSLISWTPSVRFTSPQLNYFIWKNRKGKDYKSQKTNGSEVHQIMTALTDTTLRGIVKSANEEGIKRGDIVSLLKENGQFVLIYFR